MKKRQEERCARKTGRGRWTKKAEKERVRALDDEEELQRIEDSAEDEPRLSTPPRRKRTHTLVMRTPDKPATPARPPPPPSSRPPPATTRQPSPTPSSEPP